MSLNKQFSDPSNNMPPLSIQLKPESSSRGEIEDTTKEWEEADATETKVKGSMDEGVGGLESGLNSPVDVQKSENDKPVPEIVDMGNGRIRWWDQVPNPLIIVPPPNSQIFPPHPTAAPDHQSSQNSQLQPNQQASEYKDSPPTRAPLRPPRPVQRLVRRDATRNIPLFDHAEAERRLRKERGIRRYGEGYLETFKEDLSELGLQEPGPSIVYATTPQQFGRRLNRVEHSVGKGVYEDPREDRIFPIGSCQEDQDKP